MGKEGIVGMTLLRNGGLWTQGSFREGQNIWMEVKGKRKPMVLFLKKKKNGGKIHITFAHLAIKLYNSGAFSTFRKLRNHQQYLTLGHFNPPERNLTLIK